MSGSRPKTKVDDRGRVCTKCDEYKDWDSFSKHKGGKNGRSSKCKVCLVKYVQKLRKANPDVFKKRAYTIRSKYPGGVYMITSTKGEYHVGQSKHIKSRIWQHPNDQDSPFYRNKGLIKEWKILEYIDSEEQRLIREAYWIDKLKPTLNRQLVKERV